MIPMYRLSLALLLGMYINFLFPAWLMAQPDDWRGKLKNGTPISDDDLKKLLDEHLKGLKKELKSVGKINWGELDERKAGAKRKSISKIGKGYLKQADLRNADLMDANLEGAFLDKTDLTEANLIGSNFEGAYLYSINLRGAMLRRINLKNAILRSIDLSEMTLKKANLSGTTFLNVDLNRVKFIECDLSGAKFIDRTVLAGAELEKSDLTGAKFIKMDMAGVIYEPKSAGQPDIQSMSTGENLHKMKYDRDRSGLVSLRKGFQESGFREQERHITYALKKRDCERLIESKRLLEVIEGLSNIILFEWTCGYGSNPGRPLLLMISLMGICYIIYFLVILFCGKGMLWKVLPKELQLPHEKIFKPVRVDFTRCTILETMWYPLYLSLLSAFRIGWRELNIGTWLSRSLPFEYTLVTRGWVKIIAGLQSVVCVYLLALSILTYFGRPFE